MAAKEGLESEYLCWTTNLNLPRKGTSTEMHKNSVGKQPIIPV